MILKASSAKWRPFSFGLNVLNAYMHIYMCNYLHIIQEFWEHIAWCNMSTKTTIQAKFYHSRKMGPFVGCWDFLWKLYFWLIYSTCVGICQAITYVDIFPTQIVIESLFPMSDVLKFEPGYFRSLAFAPLTVFRVKHDWKKTKSLTFAFSIWIVAFESIFNYTHSNTNSLNICAILWSTYEDLSPRSRYQGQVQVIILTLSAGCNYLPLPLIQASGSEVYSY